MISLGIDTGGTYTDAVLWHTRKGVLTKAKSPTTREDLTIGISNVIDRVLDNDPLIHQDIRLVSVSTTLATNAIVEGHGGRVCLILIGDLHNALNRAKLSDAIGSDPVVHVQGGHDARGEEHAPLDTAAIEQAVHDHNHAVNAYAVVSVFATRNHQHENRAREIIHGLSTKPVTCSIDLSSQLDAPRRALTCVLNGRLIPLIADLIHAVRETMEKRGIEATLMIMQGDGSVLRADQALLAPVETMLSGPAASIVGASKIAGVHDAVISDIGGTTTDIAIIRNGRPRIDRRGCTVAGWQTMVEAVSVQTCGLGGDSEVRIIDNVDFTLGPQRAIPIGMLASQYPSVNTLLSEQLARPAREYDGVLVTRYRTLPDAFKLTPREALIWQALESGPRLLDDVLENAMLERPLLRMREQGWIAISTITPTDAAQYLDIHKQWDAQAVRSAMELFARRYVLRDDEDINALAKKIVERLVSESAVRVFEACWHDTTGHRIKDGENQWVRYAIEGQRAPNVAVPSARIGTSLALPLIGIGAPAQAYYADVAALLDCTPIIPEDYDVCNAVGAVASGVSRRAEALIGVVGDRVYRLHCGEVVEQTSDLDELDQRARELLAQRVGESVRENGAEVGEIVYEVEESKMTDDGGEMIIERRIIAIATGQMN